MSPIIVRRENGGPLGWMKKALFGDHAIVLWHGGIMAALLARPRGLVRLSFVVAQPLASSWP